MVQIKQSNKNVQINSIDINKKKKKNESLLIQTNPCMNTGDIGAQCWKEVFKSA